MNADDIPRSALLAWRHRVLSGVKVRDQAHVDRIALSCATAEFHGDRYVNVWHESALFYGTKCHCRMCEG